ncbi:MAG: hypothetical protein ACRDJ4_01920 [Actinomycetota bacterium]
MTWHPGSELGELTSGEFGLPPGEKYQVPKLETTYAKPGTYTSSVRLGCAHPAVSESAQTEPIEGAETFRVPPGPAAGVLPQPDASPLAAPEAQRLSHPNACRLSHPRDVELADLDADRLSNRHKLIPQPHRSSVPDSEGLPLHGSDSADARSSFLTEEGVLRCSRGCRPDAGERPRLIRRPLCLVESWRRIRMAQRTLMKRNPAWCAAALSVDGSASHPSRAQRRSAPATRCKQPAFFRRRVKGAGVPGDFHEEAGRPFMVNWAEALI